MQVSEPDIKSPSVQSPLLEKVFCLDWVMPFKLHVFLVVFNSSLFWFLLSSCVWMISGRSLLLQRVRLNSCQRLVFQSSNSRLKV